MWGNAGEPLANPRVPLPAPRAIRYVPALGVARARACEILRTAWPISFERRWAAGGSSEDGRTVRSWASKTS